MTTMQPTHPYVPLIDRRTAAYDERSAEFARRQAILDVAGEAGRDPTSQLNTDEQDMFDEHSGSIRRLDQEISLLDSILYLPPTTPFDSSWARNLADALIDAADTHDRLMLQQLRAEQAYEAARLASPPCTCGHVQLDHADDTRKCHAQTGSSDNSINCWCTDFTAASTQ